MPEVNQTSGVFKFEEDPDKFKVGVPRVDPVEEEESLPDEKTSTFPDDWKQDFEGLTYLGYLDTTVRDIPYHEFVIRTLTVGEKIEIHQILKDVDINNPAAYLRAYKAAVVAATLVSVDGKPLIAVDKKHSVVREKYLYVVNSWYDPVIDILYRRANELELRSLQVLYELGIIDLPPLPKEASVEDLKE